MEGGAFYLIILNHQHGWGGGGEFVVRPARDTIFILINDSNLRNLIYVPFPNLYNLIKPKLKLKRLENKSQIWHVEGFFHAIINLYYVIFV